MCIIIVKPAGVKMPTKEILDNCKIRNKDGFGFAVPNEKPFKSMKYDDFLQAMKRVDEKQPCIIHFRFATHGSVKQKNCHPFKAENIAFAHNGVLQVNNLNGMTDSETALKYILHPAIKMFGYGSQNFEQTVASIIGGSKFAFLSDAGEIKLYGHFILDNGLYFSNDNYKPYNYYFKPSKYNSQKYIDEMYPEFSERFKNYELNY